MFWHIMLWSPLKVNRRFERTGRPYLQGLQIQGWKGWQAEVLAFNGLRGTALHTPEQFGP
jgi:hypothetical protein